MLSRKHALLAQQSGPFCCGPFWHEFHENGFFHISFSAFFFQKQLKIFLFIFNKFLSTLHKKFKFKHTATVFYLVIPVTDKINS